MIRTQVELIEALKANPEFRLYWSRGNRPADSGSYALQAGAYGESKTVHGNAANAAIKASKLCWIRGNWLHAVYRLA
jgi:hypothetical protein